MAAIHRAVTKGSESLVTLVLDNGGGPDTLSSSSVAPLHLACQNGCLKIATLLLEVYKCSPSPLCSKLRSPLHYAAMSGSVALVRYLLSMQSGDLTSMDIDGKTPLELAWTCQKLEVVQHLTCGTVSAIPNADDTSADANSCLSWVCAQNDQNAVKVLFKGRLSNLYAQNKHGKSVVHSMFEREQWGLLEFVLSSIPAGEIMLFTDEAGVTPLHLACKFGCLMLTKCLVEVQGCDPACEDSQQNTPLHYSCIFPHQEIIKYLLACPSVSLMRENVTGQTALHQLCTSHKSELILSLLLDRLLDPATCDSKGQNLAHLAAKEGLVEILGVLLTHSSSGMMQAQDSSNCTPLDAAWCICRMESVQALLQLDKRRLPRFVIPFPGVLYWACTMGMFDIVQSIVSGNLSNIFLKTPSGDTILHHAYVQKQWRIFDFLCSQITTPLRFVNADGVSAMHLVCMRGMTQVVERYVEELNCSPSMPDNYGKTPLHYACSGKHHQLILYLVSITKSDLMERDFSLVTPVETLFSSHASQSLLAFLKNDVCNLSFVNSEGQNMLHLACRHLMPEVRDFVSRHYPNAAELVDSSGNTPLDLSWLAGDLESVGSFLPSGLSIKPESMHLFCSVLHWACSEGIMEVVTFLVSNKLSNAKKLEHGKSVLCQAARNHHWKIVDYLISSLEDLREDGCVLQLACSDGQLDIIKTLVEEKHWNIMAKDVLQLTLLENACLLHRLPIIEYILKRMKCKLSDFSYLYADATVLVQCPLTLLLSASQGKIIQSLVQKNHIDPSLKTKLGRNVLHLACIHGCLPVVKYLLQQKLCDVGECDSTGNTPLHLACLNNHADLGVYLISVGSLTKVENNYGKDPLQLASEFCSAHLSSFIAFTEEQRILSPVSDFIKVFLLGYPRAGKSTLARNLELNSTSRSKPGPFKKDRRTVTGVSLNTTGIVTTCIQSSELGCMTLYDFAGQPEYYSSHTALLQTLVLHSDTLFVMVLNLEDASEDIKQKMLYWIMFASNLRGHSQFVVVCSHADVVSREEEMQKCTMIRSVAEAYLGKNFHDLVALDLRKVSSPDLKKFLSLLKQVYKEIVAENSKVTISSFCHVLMAYFQQQQGKCSAVQLGELASRLLILSESGHGHYPTNTADLSDCLEVLSNKGLILYLKNNERLETSWVILDAKSLLSEVSGTIFCPTYSTKYKPLATNTGVVPLAVLLEVFQSYNPDLLTRFLEYFEFCHKIDPLLLKDISTNICPQPDLTDGCPLGADDDLYFFPGLIKEEKPHDLPEEKYVFGWSLECKMEHQFLASHFFHVLFLRLAYVFSLISTCESSEPGLPTYGHKRKCKVWKDGIFWLDENGIATQVEALPFSKGVLLLMSYKDGCKKEYVLLRSKLISAIISLRQELCPQLDMSELLLSPSQLHQGASSLDTAAMSKFDIRDVASSIVNHKRYVSERVEGDSLLDLCEALVYEPYMLLPEPVLGQVCCSQLRDNPIPALLYQQVLDACSGQDGFTFLLQKKPGLTHASLKDQLDQFSIFAGRSVLVSSTEE